MLTKQRHKGRNGSKPRLCVMHTMEAAEGSNTAENVARYFQTAKASAHWCGDNDSRVRVVVDTDTAWTAPGANHDGLQYELAGYAKQTAADWADQYSIDALEIAAISFAEWSLKFDIPIRKLSVAQVRAGERGFCSHDDVSKAYGKSTHWDPGPNFPWPYFLGRVAAHAANISKGEVIPEAPDPVDKAPDAGYSNAGFSAAYISTIQEFLNKAGYQLEIDGRRGPKTLAAIRDFQSKNGLEVDGLPGPITLAKLKERTTNDKPSTVTFSPEYIKDVQTKLNRLGYNLKVDGSRGPNTKAAIRDFQTKQGLTVDELPGPQTMGRLNQLVAAIAPPVPAYPNVTGLQAAVRAVQDNRWGPDTDKRLEAVRAASAWAGQKFPFGVGFTQGVVGTKVDNDWGRNSVRAHDIAVAAIQVALRQMGYDPGPIDSKWGPRTEAAYQSARSAAKRG